MAKQREDRFAELEERFAGYTVYDANREKIGKVDDLFVDEDDNPEYIGVKTGFLGTKSTLIPVELVRTNERRGLVEIAADKDLVKDGPSFDDDEEITPEYEERVHAHYGLGRGRQGVPQRGSYGDYYERDEYHPSHSSAVVGSTDQRGRSGYRERDRNWEKDLDVAARSNDCEEDELRVRRVEEELIAGTRELEAGRVNLRKRVRTERERARVPIRREEVRVERVPVEHREATEAEIGEDEFAVPFLEEEVVVEKRPVVKEEIRLRKEVVEDEEVVERDVRKEEVDIDDRTQGDRKENDLDGGVEKLRHLPQQSPVRTVADERPKRHAKTDRKASLLAEGKRQRVTKTKVAKANRGGLLLEGYDALTVAEAKKQIGQLSKEELKKIRSYEKRHKNRKTLIEQLDRKIKDAS